VLCSLLWCALLSALVCSALCSGVLCSLLWCALLSALVCSALCFDNTEPEQIIYCSGSVLCQFLAVLSALFCVGSIRSDTIVLCQFLAVLSALFCVDFLE
jgi:hypothetical protein